MALWDFINELSGYLNIADNGGGFSDPLSLSPSIPTSIDFSATGGTAIPTSSGLTQALDPVAATSSGSWASWLPTLTNLLGVGYGAYAGQSDINAQQDAYSQWQQIMSQLFSRAQGLLPQQTADEQAVFKNLMQNAALQRQAAMMAMNPTQIAQNALSAANVINPALARRLNTEATANIVGSGLTQSPGAIASATANAFAPYEQANVSSFGLPIAEQYTNALGLPTPTSGPNLVNPNLAMTGLIPSNVNLPPQLLSMLNTLRNFTSGSTYSNSPYLQGAFS